MKTLKQVAFALIFTVLSFSVAVAQEKTSTTHSKTTTMKTYLIERDIPNAGKMTAEELKGASQKSCNVIKDMGPDIQWLNSYVLDNKIYCVYKATSKEVIKEHAQKSGFPATQIMEIKTEIGPETAKN